MVALRKDVKVGFVVGGIMLAVVGVYFALSAIAGRGGAKPADSDTVSLATNGQPSSSSSSSSSNDASKLAVAAKPTTPAKPDPALAKNDRPTSPATPAAAPSSGAGDDVWSNAFTTGDLKPARSVTPDLPTKTSRESAAKPSDVIRAMNDPKSATDARATNDPTAAPIEPTASAIDNTSGSMAGGATSTLTRSAETSGTGGASKTHVVAVGETLSAIAEAEYGSPNLYGVIEKANPGIDAGKLKVGQSLVIPPHDKAAASATSSSSAKPAANVDATKQYVVKPGDSLHKIASTLYGSSGEWQAIYDANKSQIGDSPANLKVGMTLTLPKPPMKK